MLCKQFSSTWNFHNNSIFLFIISLFISVIRHDLRCLFGLNFNVPVFANFCFQFQEIVQYLNATL
ncbi:hypothetical protein CW304_11930 [Bacillus sp. UFRGS-B20]|nr:hypothetical protein CW304_11930 [Bacillus sp. UFRGS-B20]